MCSNHSKESITGFQKYNAFLMKNFFLETMTRVELLLQNRSVRGVESKGVGRSEAWMCLLGGGGGVTTSR